MSRRACIFKENTSEFHFAVTKVANFFWFSRLGDGAQYNVGWRDSRSRDAFRVSGTAFKILKPKRWVDPKSNDFA